MQACTPPPPPQSTAAYGHATALFLSAPPFPLSGGVGPCPASVAPSLPAKGGDSGNYCLRALLLVCRARSVQVTIDPSALGATVTHGGRKGRPAGVLHPRAKPPSPPPPPPPPPLAAATGHPAVRVVARRPLGLAAEGGGGGGKGAPAAGAPARGRWVASPDQWSLLEWSLKEVHSPPTAGAPARGGGGGGH